MLPQSAWRASEFIGVPYWSPGSSKAAVPVKSPHGHGGKIQKATFLAHPAQFTQLAGSAHETACHPHS